MTRYSQHEAGGRWVLSNDAEDRHELVRRGGGFETGKSPRD